MRALNVVFLMHSLIRYRSSARRSKVASQQERSTIAFVNPMYSKAPDADQSDAQSANHHNNDAAGFYGK